MSHTVKKQLNQAKFKQTCSLEYWRERKKIRKRANRAYHKQKMKQILNDDADQSYQKVMPW